MVGGVVKTSYLPAPVIPAGFLDSTECADRGRVDRVELQYLPGDGG